MRPITGEPFAGAFGAGIRRPEAPHPGGRAPVDVKGRAGPIRSELRRAVHVVAGASGVDEGDGVDDRGGFSVIALSSDGLGVEIAFWADEAWAYDYRDVSGTDQFVHDEGSTGFRPDAAMTSYELFVSGSTYTLKAGSTQILTGPH